MVRNLLHGAYVGATGDLTRLRQIKHAAETQPLTTAAWQDVGKTLSETAARENRSQGPSSSR
jgi:hypothetical protein